MFNEPLCRGKTNGDSCVCGLTKAELKEAGFGIGTQCPDCSHPFGFHPVGVQGK